MKREREESVKKGEMNGVLITVLIILEHNFQYCYIYTTVLKNMD